MNRTVIPKGYRRLRVGEKNCIIRYTFIKDYLILNDTEKLNIGNYSAPFYHRDRESKDVHYGMMIIIQK